MSKDRPPYPPQGGLEPVSSAGAPPGANLPTLYDPRLAYDDREEELDLRQLWRTVRKYKWTVAAFGALVVAVALFSSLMMRPVYRATATIEVTPNPAQVVKLDNVDAGGPVGGKEYLETEFNIIRSASVGLAVIDRLELWRDPELSGLIQQRSFMNGLRQIKQALLGGPSAAQLDVRAATAEEREALARSRLGAYLERLSVRLVPGSYLFNVSFESFDPALARQVANAVTDEYMRLNDQRRFSSTDSAREFLNDEIERAQARLETSERDLYEFARRFDVVDVEDSNNIMADRLQSLNTRLSEVRNDRIDAESLRIQARTTSAEALPQLLDSPLIAELGSQYAELQSEYTRLSKVFKPAYPKLQQLTAQMDEVRRQLEGEGQRQLEALEVNYQQLQRREELLTSEVSKLKEEIFELQSRAVQYNILKREWEANKELYAGLLERLKEVGVASGLEVNNVSVIDRASSPGGPYKPNVRSNVMKAGVLGLAGGIALALLLGFLDNTIRTPEQLEQALHLASLGLVPAVKGAEITPVKQRLAKGKGRNDRFDVKKLDLMSYLKRDHELAEAYRSIRTSLMFSTPKGAPQVLLLTSASSGEGKTTAAINLATVFAQNGEKVLLVDADLRKPRIHKTFGVAAKPGLTEYLLREPHQQIVETKLKDVSLMPSGTIPPNPVELLGSSAFEKFLAIARERYTRIIIDTPPVLGLADAVIAAAKADGVVLIVSAGKVSKEAIRQSVKRLRTVYAPLVGAVLNNVDHTSAEYGEYGRYYYYYQRAEAPDEKVLPLRPEKRQQRQG